MDDVVVELGDLARFDCRVSAWPDPDISWYKDGNRVVPGDKFELLNFHDDIFSLLIKKVNPDDSGRYTCLAKNEYGEAKSEALLNVIALKEKIKDAHVAPSFVTKFYDMEVVEGVPVEFTCVIDGNPDPMVTWLLNGKEVLSSSEILTRRQDDTVMLAFRSVQMIHSGEVICKLKNDTGEAICKAKLKVNEDKTKMGDRPVFMERPEDKEINEGSEVTFECVIAGTPDPDVTWYFNGRELHESRRRVMRKHANQKYSLTLREVIPENAGVYTCKARNRAGDASCAVELSVKEQPTERALRTRTVGSDYDSSKFAYPPSFTRRISDQMALPGRMARFECQVLGVPEPEVEWKKDGFALKWGPKYKMGKEGNLVVLVVDGVDTIDEGSYSCHLYNDAGKATCSARLSVKEERTFEQIPRFISPAFGVDGMRTTPYVRPTPPRRAVRDISPLDTIPSMPIDKPIVLDVKPTSCKLSWMPAPTAMLPDKAQSIMYTVEARELPSSRWVRMEGGITGTVHHIHGLSPDKEYMFRVKAENRYGASEPTLPVTLKEREEPKFRELFPEDRETPVRPVLPKSRPYVTDMGRETVRLGWRPAEIPTPRSRSVPPVSYRVEAQKLPSEEWVPLASRVRRPSFYLSELEPDRDYNIRVRAQTPYGVSQPTEPVWLPRAKSFTGVPVSRPTISEIDDSALRLTWHRVDIPAFDQRSEPLMYMVEVQEPPSYRWRELARRVPSEYYIVRDLEPGQDYKFRVRAESYEGLLSEPSPATSVFRTLALSHVPVDRLQLEEDEDDYETVRLAWNRVEVPPYALDENPLLYMIEYQEPLMEGWRPLVSGVPTTRYRVPDIRRQDDYRFRVRALSPYGVSPPSYPLSLRGPSPMRPLSQDLQISTADPSSVQLSWRSASLPPSSAGTVTPSYQIEALELPGREWRPLARDVRDTSYRLSGLKPSADYSFRVRAMTPSGLTEPTPPVTLTSLPVRPRLPSREPQIVDVGTDSVRLQWRPAELPYYSRHTTPITYTVEKQELPGHDWMTVRRGVPETTYVVGGLLKDRDYRFRIRPETEHGPGEYSAPVTAHRHAVPTFFPKEPVFSNVTATSVKLSWQPARLPVGSTPRPIHYRIEARELPRPTWYQVAANVSGTSHDLYFLDPDQDYLFRVIAVCDGVESEPSMSAYLPRRAGPPKMPRDPAYISSVHPDSVILSWRSVELPDRITDYSPVTYRIEVQESPMSDWRPLARQVNHTHYQITGLRPDQEYSFRVRAENEFGVSDPTEPVMLKRRAVPPSMSQFEPLISDVRADSLRLTWQQADLPSYLQDSVPVTYTVLMQESPDPSWQPLARRVAGTSYYVSGLSPDKDYSFRVQAENSFGSSAPSLPARLHRQFKGPIFSPEIDDVGPRGLSLSWKRPSMTTPTTYTLEAWEPSSWGWRPLASSLPEPRYRVTDLTPARDYAFRVRAETGTGPSEPSLPISFSSYRVPSRVEEERALPTTPIERPTLSELYEDSVRISWHPTYYPGMSSHGLPQLYRLEVRELPDSYWRTLVPETSDRSYEVTDLKPNQDYAFRVRVVADKGMSEPSFPAYLYRKSVRPKVPLPSPEVSDVGDDYVNLRWNKVDVPAFDRDEQPLSFMIEAQKLPDYTWRPVGRGITDTSYRVTGIEPKYNYKFRLRGEMPVGLTQPSAALPVFRSPFRSNVPITNVTVEDDINQPYSARLRWNPVYVHPYHVPRDTTYTVEMQEPYFGDWRPVASDIPSTSYVVSDISPLKDYMFRVKAKSPAGSYSAPTPPVAYYGRHVSSWDTLPSRESLLEEYAPISRPYIENLIIKVPPRMSIEKPEMMVLSPEAVRLSWRPARVPAATASLSPTSYRVEVRHEDSFEWQEKATNIPGLSVEIKNLNPHVDYAFRVRAVNEFGWSESTLPVFLHRPQELKDEVEEMEFEEYEKGSSLFSDTAAPKMPIDSPRMTAIQPGSLKLMWAPARIPAYARKTPITYIVEKKEPSDANWQPVVSALDDTSYMVEGIKPGVDYMFRVTAHNEFGLSEPTLPAALTRSRAPSPFSRRSSSREMSRELSRERDSERRGSYSYIDSIAAGGVPPRVPQGRPNISEVTETSLLLSWQSARMPSYVKQQVPIKYIVERREPPNHLWMRLDGNVPDTKYKVTGLSPDQEYLFRVRAFNDAGMSEPSLPATLTREKPKEEEPPRVMRRRSSVERFSSVGRASMERASRERSVSQTRVLSREGSRKDLTEEDMFAGKRPDTTPTAPEFVMSEDVKDTYYGIECRPVKMTLQAKGIPLPNIKWYFDGKEIIYGDRHEGYITPTGLVVLEFFPMTWSDVGEYKCVAENELGEATFTVKLNIADPPTFLEPMRDLQVLSQGSGKFTCRVDGIPYPSVKFMKDWRPLTESSRLKVSQDGDRWTLDIDGTIPADAGCYVCVAENASGSVFCTARLSVDDDVSPGIVRYKSNSIEDDYYILEELGRGRHSIVRHVIEKLTGQEFAAKFTSVREEPDKDFFRSEMDMLLRQKHDAIMSLHDAFETPRQTITIVELLKGGELLDRIASDDQWSESQAAKVVKRLLEALAAMHKTDVVHLDIKPANIHLTSKDYSSLKLIDFGFARKLPLSSDLCFNFGTPEFAAPEQVCNEAVSPATDLWAVGVLTHLLLTGVSPFAANSVPEVLSKTQTCNWSLDKKAFAKISPSAQDFISKLLVRDPESRLTMSACQSHEWLKQAAKTDGAKLDTTALRQFLSRNKAERKASEVKTVACLRSLKKLLEGSEVSQGLVLTADPKTGETTLPDTEEYGEYLDSESWYEWQARYKQGLDTELFPLKDAPYTMRVRGYKRKTGTGEDLVPGFVDSDEELDPKDKDRMRTMKERKPMSEIDKEEIPPTLEKELEYLEESKKRRKSRDPDEASLSSKRSSVTSITGEASTGLPAPVFKEKLHNMAFGVGDTVILRCVVIGQPAPSVVWYRNEELLSDGNRVRMYLAEDGEATLTIRNAKPYDAGVYKCVGRNKFGRASNRMRLSLGDAPGRPGQPVVTQVSTQEAVVIWEAPRSDGNAEIRFYKLDFKKPTDNRWTTGPYTLQEAGVVSGLEANTSYRFRVSATNVIGTSHYSWSSVEVTTRDKGLPTILSDDFLDLPLMRSQQTKEQPRMPSEFDDIIESDMQEPEVKCHTADPDSIYNIGDTIYKGKFYEVKAVTLPSEDDKAFTMTTLMTDDRLAQPELELLKRLRHERVVRLIEVFTTSSNIYMIVEGAYGEHVAKHLSLRRKYSENVVAHVVRQVLFGLEFLQREGLLHLNLQPGSVVVEAWEGCDVRLSDFSLARKMDAVSSITNVPRLGYPDFIAPEVVIKDRVGFPADVWGVGALAFLLLSGVSPYRGNTVEQTLVNIALNRYDAIDLYENVTTEALKFLFKVMKRLPRNRPTIRDCLEHKWLSPSDAAVKEREGAVFLSNSLDHFTRVYDTDRQREDFCREFEDVALPVKMAEILPSGTAAPAKKEGKKV